MKGKNIREFFNLHSVIAICLVSVGGSETMWPTSSQPPVSHSMSRKRIYSSGKASR